MKRSHEKWPANVISVFYNPETSKRQDSREHLQSIAHIDRIQQETCKLSHWDNPLRDKGPTCSVFSPFSIVSDSDDLP